MTDLKHITADEQLWAENLQEPMKGSFVTDDGRLVRNKHSDYVTCYLVIDNGDGEWSVMLGVVDEYLADAGAEQQTYTAALYRRGEKFSDRDEAIARAVELSAEKPRQVHGPMVVRHSDMAVKKPRARKTGKKKARK